MSRRECITRGMLARMRDVVVRAGPGTVGASVFGEGTTAVLLGHGAGGDRQAPLLVRCAEGLAGSGRQVVLYNFPYTEAGRRVPDPPARLEETASSVGDYARAALGAKRIVHGGKSMGGRIASQAVAKGAPADALVFLGYPLHPPGRFAQLRDRHLAAVACPMLFVQGTRDAFAREDLLEPLIGRLGARATWHRVEGGDHSFAVTRASGRRAADVEAEVLGVITAWLAARGL